MNTKLVDSRTAKSVGAVIDAVLYHDAWRGAKYLSDRLVISATRKRYGKSGWTRRDARADIAVKIGAPNYLERKFISLCKKAGEKFPVRKIQLKMRPAKRICQ